MNTDRRKLFLDYLHGLTTMEDIAKELDVSIQRAYQLKAQLFKEYRVPTAYQQHAAACSAWVAAQDARLAYNARHATASPEYFYYNERYGER